MNDGNRLIPRALQSSSVDRVPWSRRICCKRATVGRKPDSTIAWHEHGWQAELQRRSAFNTKRIPKTGYNQTSISFTSTPRRRSQPALASYATNGLPFIVQRNGFAIVALK